MSSQVLQPGTSCRLSFETKHVSRFRGFFIKAPLDQEFYLTKVTAGQRVLFVGTLLYGVLPATQENGVRGLILSHAIPHAKEKIELSLRHPQKSGEPIELSVEMRVQYGNEIVSQDPE